MEYDIKKEFFSQADFRGIYRDINKTLKDLREYKGLTVEEAAGRIGIEPERLKMFETNKRIPSVVPLCNIIESLGGRLAVVPEESKDDPHCQFIEFED